MTVTRSLVVIYGCSDSVTVAPSCRMVLGKQKPHAGCVRLMATTPLGSNQYRCGCNWNQKVPSFGSHLRNRERLCGSYSVCHARSSRRELPKIRSKWSFALLVGEPVSPLYSLADSTCVLTRSLSTGWE